ncbi:MAG: YjbE family putative metal transport protein [Pseudomonadota bacterium]|jgi:YjbE family integral membrane protein|nr:YjbE family putative metal transport protein [Pseudomonadota bacterium]
MELISFAELSALVQVFIVDLVLAGDNAIVIAMAVAALPAHQRMRIMIFGIAAATILRIIFAFLTVYLLQITGLMLVGGVLLLWVSWRLWNELRERAQENQAEEHANEIAHGETPVRKESQQKSTRQAITQIIVADVSMSLDNVLAVAGIAREYVWVLVVGLALSIAFMGLAAVFIARLLAKHHWIGYMGLAVIIYVAVMMIYEGGIQLLGAMA